MAKTTYLLGAGASAGSLPTVDGFEKGITQVFALLAQIIHTDIPNQSSNRTKEILITAIEDLTDLLVGCQHHRSVDTYAKMLYLSNQNEQYYKLKCTITLFFELYRFYFNKTDKRYDAFFATILTKIPTGDLVLPSDINVLSWNYDYEFERAFLKYLPQDTSIHELYKTLNITHKNSPEQRNINNNFGIVKMNGTSGYINIRQFHLGLQDCHTTLKDKNHTEYNQVFPLLSNHYNNTTSFKNSYKSMISFSWEDGAGMEQIKKEIKTALSNTEKLIIIGYSFPYFNREMDKYIMDCLKDIHRVKIYVQDTKDRVHELIDNIKELRRFYVPQPGFAKIEDIPQAKFIPKTDLTQFYMPGD